MPEFLSDDVAEVAMRQVTMVLRDQMPALLAPERVAAFAVAALEDVGMLRPPPVPLDGTCSKCGHAALLHTTGCCRGEGPPAYGTCKCGSFTPRLAVVG